MVKHTPRTVPLGRHDGKLTVRMVAQHGRQYIGTWTSRSGMMRPANQGQAGRQPVFQGLRVAVRRLRTGFQAPAFIGVLDLGTRQVTRRLSGAFQGSLGRHRRELRVRRQPLAVRIP